MPLSASDWARLTPGGSRPMTVPSAATIAPLSFHTILTGNVAVATITPPVTDGHMIAIQFAGVAGVVATGNISIAVASVVGQIMLLVYNPDLQKYVPVG